MGFAESLAKQCERAGQKAEMVVRHMALSLQQNMVEMSPVDTGRFKGNWQAGVGQINRDTSASDDASGSGAIVRTQQVLSGWKPGQTIWLTNSLPYAQRLENGWSQQAPHGMVKLTVQAYGDAVKAAVEALR